MDYALGAVENLVCPPHPSLNNYVLGPCCSISSCTFLKSTVLCQEGLLRRSQSAQGRCRLCDQAFIQEACAAVSPGEPLLVASINKHTHRAC